MKGVSSPIKRLGQWQAIDIGQIGGAGDALAKNTVYQAATDGFIAVSSAADTDSGIITDSSTPPTTVRQGTAAGVYSDSAMCFCAVRKGDYWKAIAAGVITVYFLPVIP